MKSLKFHYRATKSRVPGHYGVKREVQPLPGTNLLAGSHKDVLLVELSWNTTLKSLETLSCNKKWSAFQ